MKIPGWYPDKATRGTRYWDGQRWTGDKRPQRRAFAAVSAHRGWGIALVIIGALFLVSSPAQLSERQFETASSPVASFFWALVIGFGSLIWGVYLLRGQGPSTRKVLARLQQEQLQRQQQPQSHAAVSPVAPAPQQVARDCTACGAPVSGAAGQVVTCDYCDSAQQLSVSE